MFRAGLGFRLPLVVVTLAILLVALPVGNVLAAALPTSTLQVPSSTQIGADFTFTTTFDNAGTTGYGPFIDLVFPSTGADGNDGITFTGATYLGTQVTAVSLIFPAGGCVSHPYAMNPTHTALQVCGAPGDTLVVLQLPFGSFTPGQPALTVDVGAHVSNLADLGTALTIRSRSGFQYGNDALDNPCCDASIVNPASTASSTWPGATVTPTLLTLKKLYDGPEDETATGPNFPRRYTINVDLAPGQTVANLDVTDLLPNTMAFVNVVSTMPAGGVVTQSPSVGVPSNAPSNQVTVRFPSVTGTTADIDASVTLEFFVPLNDANGSPIVPAASGDDTTSQNNARAQGNWTPIDARDPASVGNAVADPPGPEHILANKSVAVQKSVSIVNDAGTAGYSVGDTLVYTIKFQVSDYFAFQNVVLDDQISDGQRFDPSFTPTMSVDGNGFTLPTANLSAANFTVTPNYTPASLAPNDGTTTFQFRVSNELVTRARPDGRLIGGCVPVAGTGGPVPNCTSYNDGATTGTIVFQTVIQDSFSDTYPSGDPYINSGDHVDNNVTIKGDLLSVANTSTPTGQSEADTSSTSVKIVFGDLSKSVYAINGNKAVTNPYSVTPGDTVTYRIQYALASSDFENLSFVDNLPLPIFSSTEIATFDAAYDASGAAPAAGHFKLGPADSYHMRPGATNPARTTNASSNSVTFDYGTFNDPANQPSNIDILFTVTVNNQPFADKLFLTNQVQETDGSTQGATHQADAIVQIKLTEPVLVVKKGVIGSNHTGATLSPATPGPVAFTAPGSSGTRWSGTINSTNLAATPVDSNISGVDSGDLVSFAIVVENRGTSQKGAFDVTITDTLPLGLIKPTGGSGLNMRATYGDGTSLTFVGMTNGAGAADDLFTTGIRLDDPALAGACQIYDPTNGRNIIVITYDLQVDPSAPSGVVIPNRASITNYAGTEGGPNFVPVDHPIDSATTTIASPVLAKALNGTEITATGNNAASQVVVGELVNYTLTLNVPEGVTSSARITDTLDAGLAFVQVTGLMASSSVNTSTPIGVGTAPANVTVTNSGHTLVFSPGTLTNTDTNNGTTETLTITYQAVVLNVSGNQNGTLLKNSAVLGWANGTLAAVAASNTMVVEPALTVAKAASATTGDASDTVTFTLTVTNPAGSTVAHDMTLTDVIPSGMTYVAGSLTSATATALNSSGAPTLTASWTSIAPGTNVTAQFQVTIDANVSPNQSITNSATATWTSMAGTPGIRSAYNAASTERTGADGTGGALNDYAATGSRAFTVSNVALTKSLVTTSEAHTTGNNVAIGEVVRYRLAVQLPEGIFNDLQLRDNLPAGLQFLNDNTARVAFVSNGAGITSASAQAGAVPMIVCANDTGNSSALASAAVDCVLADANISSSFNTNADTYTSGTQPRFKLGNLTNADSDADAEFIVVEFNALVLNIGTNIAGSTPNNTFTTQTRNVTVGSTSGSVSLTIVEPSLPFNTVTDNKTASPTSGDAGDVISYRVTYTNANTATNADAFDVQMIDNVPAASVLNLGSITVTGSAPCASPAFTNASAGNKVDITVSRVAKNCTITIIYQATLTGSVTPGQAVTNTARLTYTSLPGTTAGERNGSGAAPNTYTGSDTAQVNVFVTAPTKSLVATSEASTTGSTLVIGEVARYRLVIRVAEGSSPVFQLKDGLPAGMTFLNDGTAKVALVSDDPGLSSSTLTGIGLQMPGNETNVAGVTATFVLPPAAISGGTGSGGAFQDGDDPTFALGNLTNTDSDPNEEYVVLEFNALAGNTAGNQTGTTLSDTIQVFVNNALLTTSNSITHTIAEPNVTTTKRILSTDGNLVTFEVKATNNGNATAFDTLVRDVLPMSLDLDTAMIATATSGSATIDSTSHDEILNRVELRATIPAGGSVTITYTAAVATRGTTITNAVTSTYTSLPGGNGTTGNSTGSTTPGGSGLITGERDGSGTTNDYTSTATSSIGSLGDRVWYDVNGNGVQDAGEVGIPDVQLQVRWFGPDGLAGNGDDSLVTVTTNATGDYLASGLPLGAGPGNYRVSVVAASLPNGLSAATYDLDSGTTSPDGSTLLALTTANPNPRTADFGYHGTATLGDRVWLDMNGDGAQDTGEPGLLNTGVKMTWTGFDNTLGTADDINYATTTSSTGAYSFANLPVGTFVVTVDTTTLPTNAICTYDLDGAGSASVTSRTLTTGENATDVDFGYRGDAAIGDTVWYDVDGNGAQNNAEPGIDGVTVTLTWAGKNSTFGDVDDLSFTTTTVNGAYLFKNLPVFASSPYRLTVTPLAGYPVQTYDADSTATANQSTLNVVAGDTNLLQDFGYRGIATQGLGDFVWEDLDGNGRQDGGEPGLDGVQVELYDTTGTGLLASTTTSGGGAYAFINLAPGTYQIKFGALTGYVRTTTTSAVATATTDSDAAMAGGFTGAVTVTAGNVNTNVDAGLYRPIAIGNLVWFDANGNGTQEAGEVGLPGVTVTVTWLGPDGAPGGGDDQIFTTTTGAGGAWNLSNLPPGAYNTAISNLPAGFTQQTTGLATFSLVSGKDRTDIDFGYRGTGSIGDLVWLDDDGNQTQNGTEPGLANIDVTVTWYGRDDTLGTSDDMIFVATTDTNGNYLVSNLPAGRFQVDVDQTDVALITMVTTANDPFTLTLAGAENNTSADFGFRGTTSLGDRVWNDVNNDGIQQAGEAGLDGITITTTWYGPDSTLGTGDDHDYTTTTAGGGYYSFVDLPAGTYRVTASGVNSSYIVTYDLDGTASASVATLILALGNNRTDVDFGYRDTAIISNASVGDLVWNDANGNGTQEAGENGIPNVTVTLTASGADGLFGTSDDMVMTTITDANGMYGFANLVPGMYRIQINAGSLPAGVVATYEFDGSLNGSIDITLTPKDVRTDIDFGFRDTATGGATGSIGDRVWNDANGNRIQDAPESGIPGVTVTLTGAGPDGVFGTSDDTTRTASTDASGSYGLSTLPAGLYRVAVGGAPLAGLTETYELDSTLDGTTTVALATGQNRTDVDFGFTATVIPPGSSSIGDRVWLDVNGDGLQDAGEPGIPGVGVQLTWAGTDGTLGTADDVVFTQTTGANGIYTFSSLDAGAYRATIDTTTLPASLMATYDLDGGAVNTTDLVIGINDTHIDVDFGYQGTGSIGDRVWNDANGNRIQDAPESGIPGVTVTLTGAGPDGVFGTGDDLVRSTTTGTGGVYGFNGLPGGQYRVVVSGAPLAGLAETYELDGSLNEATIVALANGQNRLDVDFGYSSAPAAATSSIGDRFWLDLNGNGLQDAGEPGIGGVTITAVWAGVDNIPGSGDDVVYVQTSAADGSYNFTGLSAGTYQLSVDTVTLPGGLTATFERDGTRNGLLDIVLGSGQTIVDADFGYRGIGSIGDYVWYDVNANSIQDAGEPGLPGVAITVMWYGTNGIPGGGDDISFVMATGADGIYSVDGLPLGNYSVQIGSGIPSGMTGSFEHDGVLDGTTLVSLIAGANMRSDLDFGYRGTSSIAQTVWMDDNRNGMIDTGETGIGNVTVRLTWAGPDGVFSTSDDLIITTTTASDGTYSFPNLPAGSYQVQIVITSLPKGVEATFDKDGGRDSLTVVRLGVGQTIPDVNFGYASVPTAISLASFTAERQQDGSVLIRWQTGAELDTWGFHVLRASNGTREHAERVTPELILHTGTAASGASYKWRDTTASENVTYWLEEVEQNGSSTVYGPIHLQIKPAVATDSYSVYLPIVSK